MTARPTLADGLLLLAWLVIIGEGDSGPGHLVENLMVCDTRALGLQKIANDLFRRLFKLPHLLSFVAYNIRRPFRLL